MEPILNPNETKTGVITKQKISRKIGILIGAVLLLIGGGILVYYAVMPRVSIFETANKWGTKMAGKFGIETKPNECDPKWFNQLDTNPLTSAPYMNEAYTGYSESFFLLNPEIKLVLEGNFPMARFFSAETYNHVSKTILNFTAASALFDYQIAMDADSFNPYLPGSAVDASPRNYTIEIIPQDAISSASNILRMGTSSLQEIILRFYSPDEEVTLSSADLPNVYAYYTGSGLPAPCPTFISMPSIKRMPFQIFFPGATPESGATITFKSAAAGSAMPNSAIPSYLFSYHNMNKGQAAVVRFKAPTFVNTHSGTGTFPTETMDTRYWSLSVVDPLTSMTFGGIADYVARQDAAGYVTVVVSNSLKVQSQAQARGQNFILDKRNPLASTIIFIYRNVLPSSSFWPDPAVYPANYYPTGLICGENDYLAGNCNP